MTNIPAPAPEGATAHGLDHVLRTATEAEVDEFIEHYKSMHIAYESLWPSVPRPTYRAFIIESHVVDEGADGPQGTRVVRTPILLEDRLPTNRIHL